MQVQANRRFSKGLQFGAVWTWSKFMDYVDSDGSVVASYLDRRV